MVIICFNVSDCFEDFVIVTAKGFSSEWYIVALTEFPLLQAALDLQEYPRDIIILAQHST